jgi:hypothetical protein
VWKVEAIVQHRIGSALREGEQARLGKAIRSTRKKRTLKYRPDCVQFGVWFRSLFRAEEQGPKPSSATAKASQ